jgi:hypothetical protein
MMEKNVFMHVWGSLSNTVISDKVISQWILRRICIRQFSDLYNVFKQFKILFYYCMLRTTRKILKALLNDTISL